MTRASADERRIEFDGGRRVIVFDPSRVEQAHPDMFDPQWWGARATPVSVGGRGAAWFVDAPFSASVLRHYRRGGLVARLSRDRYWWSGEERVRSVVEFALLRQAQARGLPVPAPLAAFYAREGSTYRAAILVERIDDVRTLADAANHGDAPWREVGQAVARMHAAGFDHADLNADNILVDGQGAVHIIDLDRGRMHAAGGGWQRRNLERLQRSLRKRSTYVADDGFGELLDAYEQERHR